MNKKIIIGLCGIVFTVVLYFILVAVFVYAPIASFSNRPYAYFDPLPFLGEDPIITLGERLNIVCVITFILFIVSSIVLGRGIYQHYKRKSKRE